MMALQALRGTTDFLAEDVRRWVAVEHTARRLARLYGYQELRTPIIEDAALFLRSVGETTDIVQKEMFRVTDRGGHDIVLRPEGTAPVVRAYLEHHLHKTQGFAKLFYLGPMFRAERPQAGRFRQFHQFGVEAIGSASPWVDVEVISLCLNMLRDCGVTNPTLLLSSMGCRKNKDQERTAGWLRNELQPHLSTLCKECQSRFDRNVFRVLDCKNPTCITLLSLRLKKQEAEREHATRTEHQKYLPPLFELCDECLKDFNEVCRGLKLAGIAFDLKKVFARGLDYYTGTVFEVRAEGLGAQDAVAAGGRYNDLVEELGGPSMGAFGFAAGIERLLMAVEAGRAQTPSDAVRAGVYVAVTGPECLRDAFRLTQQLRERGVSALMNYETRSLKAQFREADNARCRWVAVLGEHELKNGSVTVKDLEQGTQRTVAFEAFVDEIAGQMKPSCH